MLNEVLEITTTTESLEQAQQLAKVLIDTRLAACVQVTGPIQSLFRWEGKLCDGEEFRLNIKSSPAMREKVVACIQSHHPYDTPEVLMQTVLTTHAYGSWLRQQLQMEGEE